MKILIADTLPDACLEALTGLGCDVRFQPSLAADDLAEAIGDAVVLVVRSTQVVGEVFSAAPALNLVIRAGAGVNTIDLDAASALGVFVANCPGKNSIAVAELTLGLLLAADRRISDNVADLRQGRWNKKLYGQGRGLHGRTLGVLGLGAIGREVVHRARAFGLHCLVWSRSLTDADAEALGVRRAASPEAVADEADFVSVHVARTPQTTHLVDAAFLERMRPGAILVHTARGGVVDDAALAEAVTSGRIRAALDVFEEEPAGGQGDYPGAIGRLPGVYGTHHIGASTAQAQEAVADEVVRIVAEFRTTGAPPPANTVNLADDTPACWQLTVRHLDQVGVLAGVLDALKEEGINVQTVHNTVFAGAHAATASLHLDTRPSDAFLEVIRGQDPCILQADLLKLK